MNSEESELEPVKRTVGTVGALLENAEFSVSIAGRLEPVKAHPASSMRRTYLKVRVGDRVWVERIPCTDRWRMIELVDR